MQLETPEGQSEVIKLPFMRHDVCSAQRIQAGRTMNSHKLGTHNAIWLRLPTRALAAAMEHGREILTHVIASDPLLFKFWNIKEGTAVALEGNDLLQGH
jgi:hypothetical protein